MPILEYTFYCRRCKKLVKVREVYREREVLPEAKPQFDLVTWCCSTCGEPIIQVSRKRKRGGE